MLGVFFAVLSAISLAVSNLTLKKSFKDFPPSTAFLFDALFGFVLWGILALSLGVSTGNIYKAIPFAVVSAAISEALYFYALTKGNLSVSAVILASYSVYTVLFSFLLNGERMGVVQFMSVGAVIVGSLFVYAPQKLVLKEFKHVVSILLPFLTALSIGFSDTWSKGFINESGDYSFLFVLAMVQIPVAYVFLRLQGQRPLPLLKEVFERPYDYKHAFAGSLFNIVGTGFLWLSFYLTLASIASPITASSGALAALLAVIFLKERMSSKTLIGVLLVVAGIMVVSFTVR